MHQRINLRLKALEKLQRDETKPHKALLPEWLVEDLRQHGIVPPQLEVEGAFCR